MQNNHLSLLSQLYNEYKVLIAEQKEDSSRDSIAAYFKQKFISKFGELEPTEIIKLCYEYFWGVLSDSTEKKIFFDYNLLMFEVISSRLVRKPRILDVWFAASDENQRKLIKVLNQAQKEILICCVSFRSPMFFEALKNLTIKRNLTMKLVLKRERIEQDFCSSIEGNIEIKMLQECESDSYIIIDKRVLINGFLDWDNNGMARNKNMILIENESLARAFCENFARLWEKSINVKKEEIHFNRINEKQINGKSYKRVPLKKFEKIRAKIKMNQAKQLRKNKKRIESMKIIQKAKMKGGMFNGLFGFWKKMFR